MQLHIPASRAIKITRLFCCGKYKCNDDSGLTHSHKCYTCKCRGLAVDHLVSGSHRHLGLFVDWVQRQRSCWQRFCWQHSECIRVFVERNHPTESRRRVWIFDLLRSSCTDHQSTVVDGNDDDGESQGSTHWTCGAI